MRSIVLLYISVILVGYELIIGRNDSSQQNNSVCCSVIDMNKDSSTVLIRNHHEGWIKFFKPNPLEFAELAIGDSVDASITLNQVSRVNNRPRVYPLLQPYFGEPCCAVVQLHASGTEQVVSARTNQGDSLRFAIPDSLATRFSPGIKLYTSPTHGYAMILTSIGKDTTRKVFIGFPFIDD